MHTTTVPASGQASARATQRIHPVDWAMLALALVSIGLLVWDFWWHPSGVAARRLIIADHAICAVFLVEFLWRWRRDGWRARFPLRNWYDVLGMIPVTNPALRSLRLLRVVRVIVVLSRFGVAADRAAGEEFTYRLVNRFRKAIIDAVGDTVTIAVLAEVAAVLHRGTYTHNIALALEENEDELRGMIRDKLRDDPRAGRLSRLPFYNDVVDAILDSAIHIIRDVLEDPRTDELVADILRDNLDQLREAVRQNGVPSARAA